MARAAPGASPTATAPRRAHRCAKMAALCFSSSLAPLAAACGCALWPCATCLEALCGAAPSCGGGGAAADALRDGAGGVDNRGWRADALWCGAGCSLALWRRGGGGGELRIAAPLGAAVGEASAGRLAC
eukprot:7233003-Prymnesium_polylepis.1